MNIRFKIARVKKEFTQKQLADLANTTTSTISRIEKGLITNPKLILMSELSKILDTPVEELFFSEEE